MAKVVLGVFGGRVIWEKGKKFILAFKNFKVVDETGKTYQFTRSKVGERIKLKIGDPNKTITGVHTYILSYKVAGALTYFCCWFSQKHCFGFGA